MPSVEQIWKWISDRDAKVLFVVALLAFIGMTAWRGWIELNAWRTPPSPTGALRRTQDRPDTPPFEPIGLMAFVANQTQRVPHVPENPFRPTAETILARLLDEDDPSDPSDPPDDPTRPSDPDDPTRPADPSAPADPTAPSAPSDPTRPDDRPVARDGRPGPRDPAPGEPPTPRIIYRGVFQRSDGVIAVWIEDTRAERVAFHPIGSELHGVTVVEADMYSMTLRLADGVEQQLTRGEAVDLPPPPEEP